MFNEKETPGLYIFSRNQIFIFFLYSFCAFPRAWKCSFFLSFLAKNHQVFLEFKMAQPQFLAQPQLLALLSDLAAFAV